MKKNSKRSKKDRQHERGAVLSISILVGVVLLIMAVPFFFKLSGQYRSTDRSVRALSAFNLAEAGVERALYEISHYSYLPWVVFEDGSQTATLAGMQTADGNAVGDVDISISPLVSERRSLTSTGRIPYLSSENVARTVVVNLEKHLRSIFDFGIFADDYIWSKTNWALDSYNSDEGPYDPSNPGSQGHAGTNATRDDSIEIAQGQSSDVTGNLASGFGSVPEDLLDIIDLPAEDPDWLAGERKILPAEFEMPSVNVLNLPPMPGMGSGEYDDDGDPMFEVPAELDLSNWFTSDYDGVEALDLGWVNAGYNQGSFSSSKKEGTAVLTTADSGVYTDFTIDKQSLVQISGNVVIYVTGGTSDIAEFSMDTGSTLEILPDSSLTLILGSTTFNMTNNTIQNDTLIPSNLLILGTDQFTPLSTDSYNMYWNNNVDTYAAIYTPRARVYYESNTDLYGALLSFSLDIKNNVGFHYDEALKKIDWIKGGIPYYVITTWQERVF
jgi:hypothetical protein